MQISVVIILIKEEEFGQVCSSHEKDRISRQYTLINYNKEG